MHAMQTNLADKVTVRAGVMWLFCHSVAYKLACVTAYEYVALDRSKESNHWQATQQTAGTRDRFFNGDRLPRAGREKYDMQTFCHRACCAGRPATVTTT